MVLYCKYNFTSPCFVFCEGSTPPSFKAQQFHTSAKTHLVFVIFKQSCLLLLLLQNSAIYSLLLLSLLLTIPLILLHPNMRLLTGSSLLLSALCPLLANSISIDVTSSGMCHLTRWVQTRLLMLLQPPSRMPQASWPKTCSVITTERTPAISLASLNHQSTHTSGGKLPLSGGA